MFMGFLNTGGSLEGSFSLSSLDLHGFSRANLPQLSKGLLCLFCLFACFWVLKSFNYVCLLSAFPPPLAQTRPDALWCFLYHYLPLWAVQGVTAGEMWW